MGNLLEFEHGGVATVDQHARIDKPIGNYSIERRNHAEIGFRGLARLETVFCSSYRSLPAIDQSLRRIPLLFGLQQFVASDGTRGLGCFLQLRCCALSPSRLSLGLCDLSFCLMEVRF